MVWLLLAASALGVVVFGERRLEFHRVQINTTALLGGLKNVLGQENLVEAIGICDATPSPTARVVKVVLEHHDLPREEVKEILEQRGSEETARLEERLGILATLGRRGGDHRSSCAFCHRHDAAGAGLGHRRAMLRGL